MSSTNAGEGGHLDAVTQHPKSFDLSMPFHPRTATHPHTHTRTHNYCDFLPFNALSAWMSILRCD